MTTDPAPTEPMIPAPAGESARRGIERHRFQDLFVGRDDIRAGWRLALFVVLFLLILFLVQSGMRLIPGLIEMGKQARRGVMTPQVNLIFESVNLATALLAAGILGRIEKRRFGAYGMGWTGAFGRTFWQGVVWGLAFEGLEMLGIYAFGGFTFGTLA